MYCRNCGVSIPDDSLFCPKCGTGVIIQKSNTISSTRISPPRIEVLGVLNLTMTETDISFVMSPCLLAVLLQLELGTRCGQDLL